MVAIAHREPWKGHCVHAPGAEGGHECLYSVQWPYGSMEKVILYMLQVQKLAMNVCTLYRGRAGGPKRTMEKVIVVAIGPVTIAKGLGLSFFAILHEAGLLLPTALATRPAVEVLTVNIVWQFLIEFILFHFECYHNQQVLSHGTCMRTMIF